MMLSLSIRKVIQHFQEGSLVPSDVCSACLSRSKHVAELNAFIRVLAERALSDAVQSDGRYKDGYSKGMLDGIPVAVKDNFCTKGVKTTCSSRMLENFCPPYNATVVQKLTEAGAILLGKCNMDEFAMGCGTVDSLYGPTKNIWGSNLNHRTILKDVCNSVHARDNNKSSLQQKDRVQKLHTSTCSTSSENVKNTDWYISGGSSGGSAVAVATGAVFAALGSDTGGSVRNPAAYCGIVGLKPSYGLLSRYGLIPLVNSMDVPGILARNVDDTAIMLNALAGHDPLDSTTVRKEFQPVCLPDEPKVKGLKIGIPVEYHCPGLSSDVLSCWTEVSDLLEDHGALVSQVSLPHTQSSIACYSVLNHSEVASNMARYDGIEFGLRADESYSAEAMFAAVRKAGFGEVVRSRILSGNYFLLQRNYSKYFIQALKVRRLIAQDFEKVFSSGMDLLLTPVTLSDAPRHSEFVKLDNRQQCSSQDFCTQPVNLAGLPAVSVPVKLSKKGLPLSLQLIAPMFREDILLSTAKFIESFVNFPTLDIVQTLNE